MIYIKINIFEKIKQSQNQLLKLKLIKKMGYDYSHGYSLLKDSKLNINNKYLLNLAFEYDNYGYMSKELGIELENLFKDDNYILGIHRTGHAHMNKKTINEIFERGLIINGQVHQGASCGKQDINTTVSLYENFLTFIGQIKFSHSYKNSDGCIIVKIPKLGLAKKDGVPVPIYIENNGIIRLNPKYIYGYIPVDKFGNIVDIIHNYNKTYKTSNYHLLYDDSVMENFEINILNIYKNNYYNYGRNKTNIALRNYFANKNSILFKNDIDYKFLTNYIDVCTSKLKLEYPKGLSNEDLDKLISSYEDELINESYFDGIMK